MPFKLELTGRTPYDAVGDLCCWNFLLSRDDGGMWQTAEQLTIAFDSRTPVAHPDTVDHCDDYELNPTRATASDGITRTIADADPKKVHVTVRVPSAGKEVPITFVAPCAGMPGGKLHFFEQKIVDDKTSKYRMVELLGGSERFVPAFASLAVPKGDATVTLLAHYEGAKMGKLLSVLGIGPALPPGVLAERPQRLADIDGPVASPTGCGCAG